MPIQSKKTEYIELNGLSIELIRSRRKTLSLEIGNTGIKARAPMRMSKASIIEFINSKENWLRQRVNERPAPVAKTPLADGAIILLKNNEISLKVLEGQRGAPQLDSENLNLPAIKSTRPFEETVKSKLITWYKKQALKEIESRIAYFAPIMGVSRPKNHKLRIREYKRRWGSCDNKGDLSFNWRIIMAPPKALDYVVIHELAHCHEFNHSKRFWALVAEQMPDWKKQHDWLQINGGLLYQF